MNAENELCRKVYDHHNVLKSELTNKLLENSKKYGLSKEAVAEIVNTLTATVDIGSNKMVTDFQRLFKTFK